MSVLTPLAVLHIMSAKSKMCSSTSLPEEKRARDKPEADESTDAVLVALSMVEDMGDKLDRILKHLGQRVHAWTTCTRQWLQQMNQ